MWVLMVLFLTSCTVVEKTEEKNITEISTKSKTIETNQTTCAAGWKCIGKWKKGYLSADCQWSRETQCTLGCKQGECNVGKVCAVGFKCVDKNKMGYQTENCGWIKTKKCPGGCLQGECLPEPEKNETATKNSIQKEIKDSAIDDSTLAETKKDMVHTIKLTETTNLKFNNKNYTIQLYNLESDRAKIKINDVRSDWLSEGQSFTYRGEITLTVKEILYQRYSGGKQQVGYTVK